MVSVIVPVCNVEPYLEECLNSILQQSYTQMEIILINDGSTDGSGAICEAYARKDGRIQLIHQSNQGLSAARNCGIERASGEYICFVDSDDYLYPHCIETLLRLCVEHAADMSVCTYDLLQDGKKRSLRTKAQKPSAVEIFMGDQKMDAYLRQQKITATAWGKMYAAKLFREIRFPDGKLYEDAFIMHRLLHDAQRIAYSPQSIYVYRKRPGSITNSAFSQQKRLDNLEAFDEVLHFTEAHYPFLVPYAQANIVWLHIALLSMLFSSNDPQPALKKQLCAYCRKHLCTYMRYGSSPQTKAYLLLLCFSLPLAAFVYRLYFKVKKVSRLRSDRLSAQRQ